MADIERQEDGHEILFVGKRAPRRTEEEKKATLRELEEGHVKQEKMDESRRREMGTMGLTEHPVFSGVWMPQGERFVPGKLPSRFYAFRPTRKGDGTFSLKEHKVQFPITDLAGLAEATDALAQLYERGAGYVRAGRDGAEGLVGFVEEAVRRQKPRG